MVELQGYGARRINELSGGQQQRVALARALVFRPPVLLMDEPLGALDRKLREQMQLEIKRIQKSLGLTIIYVTHDQEEALILSDRIAIMHEGRVHQIGTPDAVYERPDTPYVASFLGESNFLAGTIASTEGGTSLIRLPSGKTLGAPATALPVGARVQAMIRPEAILLDPPQIDGATNVLPAVIEIAEYLGQSIRYFARAGECGAEHPRAAPRRRPPRRRGRPRHALLAAPGDAALPRRGGLRRRGRTPRRTRNYSPAIVHPVASSLVLVLTAVLAACDHITIGPVEPSCPICGGHGR